MSYYHDWIDDEYYADVENFESHYADEIEGRAEYPEPSPDETPALRLTNTPGQLRLPLGGGL